MLHKLGLIRKERSQRTSDPKSPELPELPPEPFHSERRYSTQELLCIFEYASNIDYSGIKVFKEQESSVEERDLFVNIILMNLPHNSPQATGAIVDISDVNVDSDSKARISLNINAKSIPYIVTTIIKRGMINWDFFGRHDFFVQGLHEEFKGVFYGTVDEVKSKNKLKAIKFSELDKFTSKLLSPLSEYKNPELMYTTEMMLIHFITDLTAHGYTEEAKVLHTFLALCKKIIAQADPTAVEHEKIVRLLALPVLRALRLTSDLDFSFTPFMTCMLNLTLGHPLFNEGYDIETYLMLYRMLDKVKQLGINISVNPSLYERSTNLPINNDIDKDYQALVVSLEQNKHDKESSQKLLLGFFRNIISRYCQFNKGAKAQDIHNVLYILKKTYEEDKHNPQKQKLCAKLLRIFLHLPVSTPELDNLFDSQIIRLIFGAKHEHDFSAPFNIANYELNIHDARHYCQQLQLRFLEAQTELRNLRDEVTTLQGLLHGKEDDYARLALELSEMKLTERQPSPQSSPQGSPPSSPPKERITTRRQPHGSLKKEKESPPAIHHTKSESEIRRPNRKLT